ncbi:MAG TPA: hypothetical protein VE011_00905 [Candidatus Dormibacteraeota bacterium]|nr:hypothetical protein [Candidatus Dormibacteraeota bacterium]
MNALVPYLAALHQQDLLEQAELRRRAKLSIASERTTPAWRRHLSAAARALDPSVERISETAIVTGRGANALPSC